MSAQYSSNNIQVDLETLSQSLTPTLIIGLGGSGQQVISRLRRFFYEKYGRPELPIVEFLWFDTDINDLVNKNHDVIDALVQLGPEEKIDATIEQEEFRRILQTLEASHPHIAKWFKKDAIARSSPTGIVDGARQIRPLGRLAFFQKFKIFSEKVADKLMRLHSNPQQEKVVEFFKSRDKIRPNINNSVEVLVVGSIAGGTGSGCFIDVGFAVSAIAQTKAIPITKTGIFFMPHTFEQIKGVEKEVIWANGYAAMRELNYYQSMGNDTELEFEWVRGEVHRVVAPVYNVVYLLENRTSDGKSMTDYTDVYKATAEFLFLDFNESTFSIKKRSLHSNANTALGDSTKVYFNDSDYEEIYPNRFSTFGISQIRLNKDRIKAAASHKFAKDIANQMVAENPSEPDWIPEGKQSEYKLDFQKLYSDLLVSSDNVSLYNEIKKRWKEGDEENGFPGFESIHRDCLRLVEHTPRGKLTDALRDKISAVVDQAAYVIKDLQTAFKGGFRAGEARQRLAENAEKLASQIETAILKDLHDGLLRFDELGIRYSKMLCEFMINRTEEFLNQLRDHKRTSTNPPRELRAQDFVKESAEVAMDRKRLAQSRELPWFPPGFKSNAVARARSRLKASEIGQTNFLKNRCTSLLEMYQGEFFSHIEEMLKQQLSDVFEPHLQAIIVSLKKKKTELHDFETAVQKFSKKMQGKFEAYNSPEEDQRNLELSLGWDQKTFEKNILSNFPRIHRYQDLVRERLEDFFVIQQEKEEGSFVAGFLNSAHSAISEKYQQDWRKFEDKIIGTAFNSLSGFVPGGDKGSAILAFYKDVEENEQEREIEKLTSAAKPRLQLTSDISFVRRLQQIPLLGCSNADFLKTVNNTIESNEGRFDVFDFSNDTIIFYRELVGFPAFALRGLADLKEKYMSQMKYNPDARYLRNLEIDIEKYPELEIPTPEEAKKRLDILEPFFLAFFVNEVVYHQNNKRFYFRKTNDHGDVDEKPLRKSLTLSAYFLDDDSSEILRRKMDLSGRFFRKKFGKKDPQIRFTELYVLLKNAIINIKRKNKNLEVHQQKSKIVLRVLEAIRDRVRTKALEHLAANHIETVLEDLATNPEKAAKEHKILNIDVVLKELKIDPKRVRENHRIVNLDSVLEDLKTDHEMAAEKHTIVSDFLELEKQVAAHLSEFSKNSGYSDAQTGTELRVMKEASVEVYA